MTNDPFSDDYTAPETTDEKETTVTEPAPASTTNEVSVTLKGGRDFDAPWVVIRAANPAEALTLLEDEATKELLKTAAKFGAVFAGLGGDAKPKTGGNSGGGGGGQRQAPGAKEHPTGRKEFCEHGEMEYKTGVAAKSGKPYKLFSCPSRDRANQCKAVFDD